MSTWNKGDNLWVLSLDNQTVTLNTQGTYVPADLEIDVVSGNAGTLTGGAVTASQQITTGSSYFTSTATSQAVTIQASAQSGNVSVTGFSAGWLNSGPATLSGDSDTDSTTYYIKDFTSASNVIVDNTYGTEIIGTAGWVNSFKIRGIAPDTSGIYPFTINNTSTSTDTTNVMFSNDGVHNGDFTLSLNTINDLTIDGTTKDINSLLIEIDALGIDLIDNGNVNASAFTDNDTPIPGNTYTVSGPCGPIKVSRGWNNADKTITVNLSTTTINASGETTLSQISAISSGGTDYLAFSASTGAVVSTPGYIAAGTTSVVDSSVNSGIPYYDGQIDH